MLRTPNCLAKLERLDRTLAQREPDRVPIGDSFWSSFVARWRLELGLPAGADPTRYYDLDWVVTVPNVDPHIRPFEVLKEDAAEVVLRTGFDAVIQKRLDLPMPAYLAFETNSLEKMAAFRFDDPWDERRYLKGGDNQIAGVGDTLVRNSPPWLDGVREQYPDFPVYGAVCEGYELLWRIIGSEHALLWMGLYPSEVARFVERINSYNLELLRAQIAAAGDLLAGIVIYGDVAYRKDMLFAPGYWRQVFQPGVKALVEECHAHGLPALYHGCGNARRIFADLIALGIDAYNPLEAKAGLDVVDLRREYGHGIFAFWGNMDVMEWARCDSQELRAIVLRKLNAAKGGGYLFGSDHSVAGSIPAASYDTVIRLVRALGRYPLQLGEYDIADLSSGSQALNAA
jgi:uroporphyrinogen decarboxylase